jgi:hypothetical protein
MSPQLTAGGKTKRVGGWSQVPAVLGPAFRFSRNWLWETRHGSVWNHNLCWKLFLLRLISTASFTRWSKQSAMETDAMTSAGTIFHHCWLLRLVQTYVALVFFASHLNSSSTLYYIHFPALAWNPIYTWNPKSWTILGRHQNLCGFPFWDVNWFAIMFLEIFTNFIADDVMKGYHNCTCTLFVFQLWFQILQQGLSDSTVPVSVLFEDLLKMFLML